MPLQLVVPVGHTRRHAPAEHAPVPLDGLQVRPHAPQLATDVAVLVSQPLLVVPSQSP